MKKMLPIFPLLIALAIPVQAQGNADWEELWMIMQPPSTNGPYGWMAGQRQYTGLAYDRFRDNLYIVNPGICTNGPLTVGCAKIHIWDPATGTPKTSIGRAAEGVPGITAGEGGQLPLPPDTIKGVLQTGWPGGVYSSFSQGQFPVYKVDVDDEGRIFACNLVSPLYGICFPGPPPNCQPELLGQGPVRIWRWNAPDQTPVQVYSTLNSTLDGPGTLGNSEMTWTRWGDAFDVVGKRGVVSTPGGPRPVDSVRIFISGGTFSGQTVTNREINVITTDERPSPVFNGNGVRLQYFVGLRMVSSLEGVASHGIAATGPDPYAEVWMDSNSRPTVLNNQNANMTRNYALSSNPVNGTGESGSLAFVSIPFTGLRLLVCADGLPSNLANPTLPNENTRARVMNVSITGAELREPGLGDTPFLGQNVLSGNSGQGNYIADVDYKLDPDLDSGKGYRMTLFVLMSNNGIAAFRSRKVILPVTFVSLHASVEQGAVILSWDVASEVNNAGFAVQRSFSDGASWETLGMVPGRGTDRGLHHYMYADPVTSTHRSLGSVQYRLKQVDTDGGFATSPSVTALITGDCSIFLSQNFPNPFGTSARTGAGQTTIAYRIARAGRVALKVYNQFGEAVRVLEDAQRDAGSHALHFDGAGLPAGNYIYQLEADGALLRRTLTMLK